MNEGPKFPTPEENNPEEERKNEEREEEERKKAALQEGLPEDATWTEIELQNRERRRKAATFQEDLPENTEWGQIETQKREKQRKEAALEKGLPEDASWEDISRARLNEEGSDEHQTPESTPENPTGLPPSGKFDHLQENSESEPYEADTVINGVEMKVHQDIFYGEYVIYFPQIDLNAEAQEKEVPDQVIRISEDPKTAEKAFEYASTLAEIGIDVYEIYKKMENFINDLRDAEEENAEEEEEQEEEGEKMLMTPENVAFDTKKYTLLLDLNKDDIDLSEIQDQIAGEGFEQKNEFHITVLSFKKANVIKKALKALPDEEKQSTIEQISLLVDETDWNISLEPQIHHLKKEYPPSDPQSEGEEEKQWRESYVQMVNMQGIETFYEKLNALLGTDLEAPPTHITLSTGGNEKSAHMGIAVNTAQEMEDLTVE